MPFVGRNPVIWKRRWTDDRRRRTGRSNQGRNAACIPVRKLVRETTDRGGIIRLEYWPGDGYVLWYHGQIVWKEWESA